MNSIISNPDDGDPRHLDNNLLLPFGAEAQTPTVPGGTAAGPCPEVPAPGSVRVRCADVQPGTSLASLTLNEAGVSQLVLEMLVLVINLVRSSHLKNEVDVIAKGSMPSEIHGVVCGLLRYALVNCPQSDARRRDYAAELLPEIPSLVVANSSGRIRSCALTESGYDLIVKAGDGSAMVVSVVMPSEEISAISTALLDAAAQVLSAPSLAESQMCVRNVASNQYPQPLADAIALAIIRALVNSPGLLSEANKSALFGLESLSAITDRGRKSQLA